MPGQKETPVTLQGAGAIRGLGSGYMAKLRAEARAVKQKYAALTRETKAQMREKSREMQKQSRAALKEFRRDIAKLKRAGIVSKKVDARSASMTRHLKRVRKDFAAILQGQAKTVRASKAVRDKYKSMGFKVAGDRIMTGVQKPDSRVRVNKRGEIVERIPTPRGPAKKITFPIAYSNMQEYLDGLDNIKWDAGKGKHDPIEPYQNHCVGVPLKGIRYT